MRIRSASRNVSVVTYLVMGGMAALGCDVATDPVIYEDFVKAGTGIVTTLLDITFHSWDRYCNHPARFITFLMGQVL